MQDERNKSPHKPLLKAPLIEKGRADELLKKWAPLLDLYGKNFDDLDNTEIAKKKLATAIIIESQEIFPFKNSKES